MFTAHITSVIVHSRTVTTWPDILTILVPLTMLLTTVAAYPGNMLFNHLTSLVNSSTEPSLVTSRVAFQL
jgi:hypothetical protein